MPKELIKKYKTMNRLAIHGGMPESDIYASDVFDIRGRGIDFFNKPSVPPGHLPRQPSQIPITGEAYGRKSRSGRRAKSSSGKRPKSRKRGKSRSKRPKRSRSKKPVSLY